MSDIKKDLEFKDFINWAFMALLVGCIVYAVNSINKLNLSVEENNRNVTVLIERTIWHEKTLKRHDRQFERIDETLKNFKNLK